MPSVASQVARVGRRVAELRGGKGWTQEAFAERARRSVQWVRRIESGRANITLRTFFSLAALLGAKPDQLLERPATMRTRRGRPPGRMR